MSVMARRNANFSHDRRGCAKLFAHITGLLDSGSLDKDIIELNLNGTRASSGEDRRYIQKIVGAFAQVRAILLNGCCLQNVDFLAQLLCSKFFSCKRLDLTGNYLTQQQLESFIATLEGRSYKKSVTPFFLAVGEGMDDLLTPSVSMCNPYSANGCRCQSKRVVHVISSFSKASLAKLPSPSRALPPPPEEAPPSPPDPMFFAKKLANVREQLREAVTLEKERGRTVTIDETLYVLAICRERYFLIDFETGTDGGLVEALGGECLPLDQIAPVQAEPPFPARAARFKSGATPGSYIETEGGESIQFVLHSSFIKEGWVAATLDMEWGWFPLSLCRC